MAHIYKLEIINFTKEDTRMIKEDRLFTTLKEAKNYAEFYVKTFSSLYDVHSIDALKYETNESGWFVVVPESRKRLYHE